MPSLRILRRKDGSQLRISSRNEVSRAEHDKDQSVLTHIQRLVDEEHGLFKQKSLPPEGSKRLAEVQVELDQCWDLLRQRRALRETGGDPSQAYVRPSEVVSTSAEMGTNIASPRRRRAPGDSKKPQTSLAYRSIDAPVLALRLMPPKAGSLALSSPFSR